MIWLTTRQNRFNALWMALALAAVAVAVLGAARWLASSVADPALRHCLEESAAGAPTTPYCNSAVAGFSNNFRWLDRAIYATMLALPAVVGCLVAVPMISREFEDGTYRLCWTQSVTRVNWFVSKVAAAVGVAVVAGGTAGVAAMVWAASAGPLGSFAWPRFDMYPPALVGYGVFCTGLALLAAMVLRRTVPAMAATGVVYLACRVPFELGARPRLLPPLGKIGLSASQGGAWLLDGSYVYPDGHQIPTAVANKLVQSSADLAAEGIRWMGWYQPANRFWLFQGLEMAAFVILGAACVGAASWVLRRVG